MIGFQTHSIQDLSTEERDDLRWVVNVTLQI